MEFTLVGWRSGMIVAGCAIVFAGTYFLWTEYQERVERLERIERARKELFGFAEAEAHETEKVRVFCRNVKAGTVAVPADSKLPRVLKRCRDFEYLN
jgi:hypothetical protein